MDCEELENLKSKLENLHDTLSKIVPLKDIETHPFNHFKSKIHKITAFIDQINEEANEEVLKIEEENRMLYWNIKKMEESIESVLKVEYPEYDNLLLVNEYLLNEKGRLMLEVNKIKSEMKVINKEIAFIKEELGVEEVNDKIEIEIQMNEIDDFLLRSLNNLKEDLENYRKEKHRREENKKFMIQNIKDILNMLKPKIYDDIEMSIKRGSEHIKIKDIENKFEEMKKRMETRKSTIKKNVDEIKKILGLLEDCVEQEFEIEERLDDENYDKLEGYLVRLKIEQEKWFNFIFNKIYEELKEIYKIFGLEIIEYERNYENLEIMKNTIDNLEPKKDSYLAVCSFIEKRENFVEKMIEFEKIASDPKRLFKSSFQLINEEKFRKSAIPSLLRIEEDLFREIKKYEDRFGDFYYRGIFYRPCLETEIDDRIINKSVFISNKCDTPRKGRK